jgi:hypothetical protein
MCAGGARNVDTFAEEWAMSRGVPFERFDADWNRFGNRAGPIRNQEMIDEFKPDVGLVFPGGPGTADMKRRLKRHKIHHIIYDPEIPMLGI